MRELAVNSLRINDTPSAFNLNRKGRPHPSDFVNVRITVEYDDRSALVKERVNPYTFDSMGGTRLGVYYIRENYRRGGT